MEKTDDSEEILRAQFEAECKANQKRYGVGDFAALFLTGIDPTSPGCDVDLPRPEGGFDDADALSVLAELCKKKLFHVSGTLRLAWSIPNYHEYVRTAEWSAKAEAAKEAAGWRCQICNAEGDLDAHHRTYERLGHEMPSDLIALCRDCHALFHEHSRLVK